MTIDTNKTEYNKKIDKIIYDLETAFKSSNKLNVFENFAMLAMFILETAGEDYIEGAAMSVLGALGPIEIEDEEVFMKDLDIELQSIEDLAEYFDDFAMNNPQSVHEVIELGKEAQEKWTELRNKVRNYFNQKVSQDNKQKYNNLIEDLNKN